MSKTKTKIEKILSIHLLALLLTACSTSDPITSNGTAPPVLSTSRSTLSAAESAQVNTSVTVTLQLKDQYGNNFDDNSLNVIISVTGSARVNGSGNEGTATYTNGGRYTAMVSNAVAGMVTVTAKINGTDAGSPIEITFTMEAVARVMDINMSTLSAPPGAPQTGDSVTVTFQLKDQFGDNFDNSSLNVIISVTGSAKVNGGSNSGRAVYASGGRYTAMISNDTVEMVTVSASINGTKINAEHMITFGRRIQVPRASMSSLAVDQATVPFGGSATVTLTVNDESGTKIPMPGLDVSMISMTAVGPGESTTAIGAISYNAGDGTYAATITNSASGQVTISAAIGTDQVGNSVMILFESDSSAVLSLSLSTLTASSTRVENREGHEITLTLEAKDGSGSTYTTSLDNITMDVTGVNFNPGMAIRQSALVSLGSVTNNNDGTYTAVMSIVGSPDNGTYTFTAKSGNQNFTDTAEVIVYLDFTGEGGEYYPSDANSTLVLSSSSITLGQTPPIMGTLTLKNANNAVLDGEYVIDASLENAVDADIVDFSYDGNGIYTFSLSAPRAVPNGRVNLKIGGSSSRVSLAQRFTVNSGTPSKDKSILRIAPLDNPFVAGKAYTITLALKNQHDFKVSQGGTSGLNITNSGVASLTDIKAFAPLSQESNNFDHADYGLFTREIKSDGAGTAVFSGMVGGTSLTTGDLNIYFETGSVVAGESTFAVEGSDTVELGAGTLKTILTLKDANGATVEADEGNDTFAVEVGSGGTITASDVRLDTTVVEKNGFRVYQTEIINLNSVHGMLELTASVDGTALSDTVTLTFGRGIFSHFLSGISISPKKSIMGETVIATTIARNRNGALIEVGIPSLIRLASSQDDTIGDDGTPGAAVTFGTPVKIATGTYRIPVTSNAPGVAVLQARANGSANTIGGLLRPEFEVGDPVAERSTFAIDGSSAVELGAGTLKTILTLKNMHGITLTAGEENVPFAVIVSGGTIAASNVLLNTTVVEKNGRKVYQTDITGVNSAAGSLELTASINGIDLSTPVTFTFTRGSFHEDSSEISINPTSLVVGQTTTAVTTAKNANGALIDVGPPSLTRFSGVAVTFGTPVKSDTGTYTIPITSTTAGTVILQATTNGDAHNVTTPNPLQIEFKTMTDQPSQLADASKSTLSVLSRVVLKNETAEIILTLKDSAGMTIINNTLNDSSATEVKMRVSSGTAKFADGTDEVTAALDFGSGTYRADLVGADVIEAVTVSATIGAVPVRNSLDISFVDVRPVPSASDSQLIVKNSGDQAVALNSSIEFGDHLNVAFQLKDASDNNIIDSRHVVTLRLANGSIPSVVSGIDEDTGAVGGNLGRNTDGSYALTLSIDGSYRFAVRPTREPVSGEELGFAVHLNNSMNPFKSYTVGIDYPGVDKGQSTFTVPRNVIFVGETIYGTLTLRNKFGIPSHHTNTESYFSNSKGKIFSLHGGAGNNRAVETTSSQYIDAAKVTENSDKNVYTVKLRGYDSGTITIRAARYDESKGYGDDLEFLVVSTIPSADHSTVAVNKTTFSVDDSVEVTVALKTSGDTIDPNPHAVTVSSDNAMGYISMGPVTRDAALGQYTFELRNTKNETFNLIVYVDGRELTTRTSLTSTPGLVNGARSFFMSTPASSDQDIDVTLHLRDRHGNPILPLTGLSITLAPGDSARASVVGSSTMTDNNDGTYTGTVSSINNVSRIAGIEASFMSGGTSHTARGRVEFLHTSQSITHNGITYETIGSRSTGRVWLDRNLGAGKKCGSFSDNGHKDSGCYGSLYQWGRPRDGHQLRTSGQTYVDSDDPMHANYISPANYNDRDGYDWRVTTDNGLWTGAESGGTNNVCPTGFRVPILAEFEREGRLFLRGAYRSEGGGNYGINARNVYRRSEELGLNLPFVGHRAGEQIYADENRNGFDFVGGRGTYWTSEAWVGNDRFSTSAATEEQRKPWAVALRFGKDRYGYYPYTFYYELRSVAGSIRCIRHLQ